MLRTNRTGPARTGNVRNIKFYRISDHPGKFI